MKVAIVGTGPGGAYMYRCLSMYRPDVQVHMYGNIHSNRCKTKPCGWGVNASEFMELCAYAGIDASRYLLGVYDKIKINDVPVRADVAVIDKPNMLRDMVADTKVQYYPITGKQTGSYDRIIDATGVGAFLPGRAYMRLDAIETKCRVTQSIIPMSKLIKSGGYAWAIPLQQGYAHIGASTPAGMQQSRLETKEMQRKLGVNMIMCSCAGEVTVSGPVLPFVHGNVWGLGESIGLVEPVIGAGITAAMSSARTMCEYWDNPNEYERAVTHMYEYMRKEAQVVSKASVGGKISVTDIPAVIKGAHHTGIYPNMIDYARIMTSM